MILTDRHTDKQCSHPLNKGSFFFLDLAAGRIWVQLLLFKYHAINLLLTLINHLVTGRYPSLYFRFCWLVACPSLLLALWVVSLVDYTTPGYRDYQFPVWAQVLGWIIASLSLLCIPVYAIITIVQAPGDSFREVSYLSIIQHNKDVACIFKNILKQYTYILHGVYNSRKQNFLNQNKMNVMRMEYKRVHLFYLTEDVF